MNIEQLKQRIAECIPYFQKQSAVGYNECIVGRKAEDLLRDCLTHIEELERDNVLLKEQLRVADVCSDYHMKRARMVEQANENANKAVEALCLEIEKLYKK